MNNYKFDKQQIYGIYMTFSEWSEIIEVLMKHDPALGECIGDEIGILLSSDIKSQRGCPECMHRDECIIKANKPICKQYLNMKVIKP